MIFLNFHQLYRFYNWFSLCFLWGRNFDKLGLLNSQWFQEPIRQIRLILGIKEINYRSLWLNKFPCRRSWCNWDKISFFLFHKFVPVDDCMTWYVHGAYLWSVFSTTVYLLTKTFVPVILSFMLSIQPTLLFHYHMKYVRPF